MKYIKYLTLLVLLLTTLGCTIPIRREVHERIIRYDTGYKARSDKFQICAERFAKLSFQSEGILSICQEAFSKVN